MKVLFVQSDGRIRVEEMKPFKAQIELPDGNHPITNKAIFRDANHKWPSIMLVWQGLNAPEGEDQEKVVTESVIAETDYTKIHKQKPSVSKLWVRALFRFLKLFAIVSILTLAITLVVIVLWVLLGVLA